MLKRQESSLSSSRRQSAAATPPPPATNHAKSIGCMSGIIHLFSKYQTPNKRLTFGKKQVKRKPPSAETKSVKEDNIEKQNFDDDAKKLKCEIKFPRSPTIPAEIRRSEAAASSPQNQRTRSTSLVARLMGLEDMGCAAAERTAAFDREAPITEKRQRLLQALEKCNEDLEALKKIIKAVQTSDARLQPPHTAVEKRIHSSGDNAGLVAAKPCIKKCTEVEANIPVGIVDELTRSPPANNFSIVQSTTAGAARVPLQRKPTALTTSAKKPGEDYDQSTAKIFNNKCSTTINDSYSSLLIMRRRAAASPPWSSRALVQSVEEVCGDIAWGEKRELGRIGLVLQDHLCRELIDELVKDLLKLPILSNLSLPLEACKRRLCF